MIKLPVVRVFLVDSQERVLLVKTHHVRGPYWIVPGGMIEPGEFSREAAVREVKEETGLDIMVRRLLWVEESKNDTGHVDYIHYFQGDILNGEMIIGTDPELEPTQQKILNVRFLSKAELQSLPRVYPEVLLDELFWQVIQSASHDPYVNRPSKGFGIR